MIPKVENLWENNGIYLRLGLIIFILLFNTNHSRIFSEEQIIQKPAQKHPITFWQIINRHIKRGSLPYHEGPFVMIQRSKKSKTAAPDSSDNPYRIMGTGTAKVSDMARFIKKYNPKLSMKKARKIARLYIQEANDEGVNYEVAFTQMCLETGYLKFNGTVFPYQNNLCGLGVTGQGIKGLSFSSLQMGIRAHIQHLKAYASNDSLKHQVVDARFKYVKRGSVRDIRNLTGKWAADPRYGKKLENLLKRLMAETNKPEQTQSVSKQIAKVKRPKPTVWPLTNKPETLILVAN